MYPSFSIYLATQVTDEQILEINADLAQKFLRRGLSEPTVSALNMAENRQKMSSYQIQGNQPAVFPLQVQWKTSSNLKWGNSE